MKVKSNGSKSVRNALPDLPSYTLHFARARTVVPMHHIVVHGAPRCKRAMSVLVNRQLQTNLVLLITAPAPSILFCVYCAYACTRSDKSGACIPTELHPLVLLHALFFLNVCVIFWLLSLVQGSTWVTFKTPQNIFADTVMKAIAYHYRRLACELVAGLNMCLHDSHADAAYRPLLDVSPCAHWAFLLVGVPQG